MSKLPRINARQAIRAFEKAGFQTVRCRTHNIMQKDGIAGSISIPLHKGKTIGAGLLSRQIKLAGLTIDQFIDLLKD